MPETPMHAAIAAVWQRSIPQTRERLALLQRAAEDLATSRTIDPELHEEARSTAHKLAGSLGMFGFPEATGHARAIEEELTKDGLPQPEHLQQLVTALCADLENKLTN